jgi:acyl carrier protein
MISRTPDEILADLSNLLRTFNGKEYSGDIGPRTRFFADLGMMSIDAVILAETLERLYQRSFPFGQVLSAADLDGHRDIELGKLAEFLHRHMIVAGE